ncbi:hypothetical protein KAI87_04060, partial [Myxococcota bacterium]|nr:hypothetical protein [Myxococcota bacterium]
MKYKVACATNDGKTLPKDHFGGARRFDVYEVSEDSFELLESINNVTQQGEHHHHDHGEEGHGQSKAEKILSLFEKHEVQVVVSQAFGHNFKFVKTQVLPVISRVGEIEEALALIQNNFPAIQERLDAGEERKHLILK